MLENAEIPDRRVKQERDIAFCHAVVLAIGKSTQDQKTILRQDEFMEKWNESNVMNLVFNSISDLMFLEITEGDGTLFTTDVAAIMYTCKNGERNESIMHRYVVII